MQSMHPCIYTDSCKDRHLHKKVYLCYSKIKIRLRHVHRHTGTAHTCFFAGFLIHELHNPQEIFTLLLMRYLESWLNPPVFWKSVVLWFVWKCQRLFSVVFLCFFFIYHNRVGWLCCGSTAWCLLRPCLDLIGADVFFIYFCSTVTWNVKTKKKWQKLLEIQHVCLSLFVCLGLFFFLLFLTLGF